MEIISDWTESTEHPGYRVKVMKHGNATLEVYRPILNDAERKKIEAHVKAVAERTLYNYYKRKEEEKCQTESQLN